MSKDSFPLSAQKRETAKKSARYCRQSGRVPGVVYGPHTPPQALSLDRSDILRTFRKAGKSTLVDLDLDGNKITTLIHDIQWHPVQTTIHHIDFFAVDLKKKTTVEVPLVFEGEAPAVKNLGGVLMKDHETIDIRCLPSEIPHDIKVDISGLENLHDHITIKELNLDEKFEVMHLDIETVVCSIAGRAAEEEEETTQAAKGEAAEGAEGADGGEGDAKSE